MNFSLDNLTCFYIDGAWVDPVSPRTLDVVNPANESVIAKISMGNREAWGH